MFALLMGLKSVSPDEVRRLLATQAATVFDVNNLQSWQAAHVPGARHLDPLGFAAGDLPADQSAQLVFYCSSPFCRKAPNAARRAKQMGYANAMVMSAGIRGWQDAMLPTEAA